MTRPHAEVVRTWAYEPPYDGNDMTGASVEELLDPAAGFHAVLGEEELVAFRSFGADGRVPGWDYDESALDTGGGLRPDLVGQGLGREVLAAGLAFGRETFAPAAFRVTVGSDNLRALRVVEAVGFVRAGHFQATHGGRDFEVLVRQERA